MMISGPKAAVLWCRNEAGRHRNPLKKWALRFVATQLERAIVEPNNSDHGIWVNAWNVGTIEELYLENERIYRALDLHDPVRSREKH